MTLLNESTQAPADFGQLVFWVQGTPVQQGSKTAFVIKGRAVMTDQNHKKLKPWRALVTAAAVAASVGRPQFLGPLAVTLDFYMPRGVSVKRARPSVTPDIDKLVRSVLDGITDSGVWGDDALVVSLTANEFYADERPPGVRVQINTITD